jgi:hypothetical protein
MIEWILWLLWLISLFFFGTSSEVSMPPQAEAMMQLDHVIESVDPLILESYPMQLQLHVTGYHDGCDYPTQVSQSITGSTINVRIYREMPLAVICPANIITYDETIAIEGGFTGGAYTIVVNNFTTQVDFGGELPTATPFGVPTGANLVVESVNASPQSAAPATVIIRVTGYFEDACDLPIMTSQTRDGSTFNISLSREIPPNVRCAAGPTPFSIDVTLNEQLMEGAYTVNVNGVVITFNVA